MLRHRVHVGARPTVHRRNVEQRIGHQARFVVQPTNGRKRAEQRQRHRAPPAHARIDERLDVHHEQGGAVLAPYRLADQQHGSADGGQQQQEQRRTAERPAVVALVALRRQRRSLRIGLLALQLLAEEPLQHVLVELGPTDGAARSVGGRRRSLIFEQAHLAHILGDGVAGVDAGIWLLIVGGRIRRGRSGGSHRHIAYQCRRVRGWAGVRRTLATGFGVVSWTILV